MLISGCSSEKNTTLSKSFHNLASHYNAYYYARENIRQVEYKIDESLKNDYDEILPILSPFDSILGKSYQEEIDETIKMASIGIQRHPGSRWVDDSYLLIGLARMYSSDFVNAITTFKYINTKSENTNTRHRSLIYLLRAFTEYKEYNNAISVIDYLNKQELNQENKKLFYIYTAYYHQVRGDLDKMLTSMVNAAPILSRNDGRGKFYFILGQNYQALGFESEAYNNYKKCLATNPPYEQEFYAKLNMAQVAELNKSADLRNARKLFKKLLSDKKNKEFKDKIYYEMAEFELRQGNIDESMDYLNLSVRNSQGNNKQKGLSFLRMGQIQYDSLKNYRTAQAYYDSCSSVLPKDHQLYESIKSRSEILNNFVAQLNTIELQDSLLVLSNMDSLSLYSLIETEVKKQKELEKKQKEKHAKENTGSSNRLAQTDQTSTSTWYFGNTSAVAIGRTEFRRIWGDISYEDNWRRSNKDQGDIELINNQNTNPIQTTASSTNTKQSDDASIDADVQSKFASVPRTEEQKKKSYELIEEALYQLGNIYHFQLDESLNAANSFEQLIKRFPESPYNVESMYLLYLIYEKNGAHAKAEKYKNILLNDYPKTTYARLILNPNYTEESSVAFERLSVLYDSAYSLFTLGQLNQTKQIINQALSEYEDLQISNRFRLLNILITGKLENINIYQYQLGEFIKNYPDSEQRPYAEELLQASRDYQDKLLKANAVKYIEFFEQEHYLIIAYKTTSNVTDGLISEIEKFNSLSFPNKTLKVSNLIFEKNYFLAMVTDFPGAKSSLSYYDRIKSNPGILNAISKTEYRIFTITKDNFGILYKSKDIESYMRFFNENY